MAYLILFMVEKTRTGNLFPIFSSYEWWIDSAKNALEFADEFEMRLWEDDVEAIKSGERFGKKVPNNQSKEIVYKGSITPDFKKEVLTNYLASEGHIKWFSLILKRKNESIFSSEHYGDETYILVNTKEEVEAIQNCAKNHTIIWRVDVHEYNGVSE